MTASRKSTTPKGPEGLDANGLETGVETTPEFGVSLGEWVATVGGEAPTPMTDGEPATALSVKPAAKKTKAAPAPQDELDAAIEKLNSVASVGRRPRGKGTEGLEAALSAAAETARRSREQVAKTAQALGSVATWIEHADDRLTETKQLASDQHDRAAAMLTEAMSLMTGRLDEIERKLDDGGRPSVDAALKAVERIEHQLETTGEQHARTDTSQIETVLRGFENRISQITDRLAGQGAAPRAIPPTDDLKTAVSEIRARQAELEQPQAHRSTAAAYRAGPDGYRPHREILHSIRHDIAQLAAQMDGLSSRDTALGEVKAVRADIERLEKLVSGLATRDEVGGLERTLHSLGTQVGQPRDLGHLADLHHTIEELQSEVRRLSELVASGLQGHVAGDLDALGRKIDAVAGHGVDAAVISGLTQQLTDVRQLLTEIADPERVRSLAQEVADLDRRFVETSLQQDDTEEFTRRFELIAERLENLDHRRSENDVAALADQVGVLAARVERNASFPADDLARQIEGLSLKLDRLGEKPRISVSSQPDGFETVIQRLDQLETRLVDGATPQLKPIEDLLVNLVDRIDAVERTDGNSDALDSLERQVAILVGRLEPRASDPTLSSFERTMGDLLAQIEALRVGAFDTATVAAKTAVAETLATLPKLTDAPALSAFKGDLDDLKLQQSAVDMRVHATLENVHGTLDRMAARLGNLEGLSIGERSTQPSAGELPSLAMRVKASSLNHKDDQQPAAKPAHAAGPAEADAAVEPAASQEILLEPGTGRPRPDAMGRAVATESSSDLKASFIAAARRAAQAASEEAAASNNRRVGRASSLSVLTKVDGARASLAARMKGTVDKHRRPILLGLAAVVLALGAMQAIGLMGDSSSNSAVESGAAGAPMANLATPLVEAPAALVGEMAGTEGERGGAGQTGQEPNTSQAVATSASQSGPASATTEPPRSDKESTTTLAGPALTPAQPENAKPGSNKTEPKLASAVAPESGTPVQITSAAPQATAINQPSGPTLDRVAKIASVGELPVSPALAGLRQAALNGDAVAVYEMASRLAEGRGFPRDLQLAAKLFEKAAAAGLVPAQYRIGNHYEKGLGVPRDVGQARSWYQRAADGGNARAMHNLAVLLAQGGDGKTDYTAAAEWFRRAAEHGIKDSQFNLAVLLARGLGVPQNLAQSYTWFTIAAAQGDEDAAKKRDEVGSRLAAADLSSARTAAEKFRPATPDQAKNEVSLPAQGWAEAVPPRAAPVNNQRSAKRV